ncbi:GD17863 [Drosophila simulans]|uniref:GD17863 n=1 Tax=Drosophila simulans TaxID=7240 RepID=B4NTU3_DROSI|nr:GD17863 [Drosophila simulans]
MGSFAIPHPHSCRVAVSLSLSLAQSLPPTFLRPLAGFGAASKREYPSLATACSPSCVCALCVCVVCVGEFGANLQFPDKISHSVVALCPLPLRSSLSGPQEPLRLPRKASCRIAPAAQSMPRWPHSQGVRTRTTRAP